jgi:Domain of unknown function (DUF4136)
MCRLMGLAVLLVAAPVMAQKVTIDYAKDVDFKSVHTFQYVASEPEPANDTQDPFLAERITEMLKAKLTEDGLREVMENPDFYVTYHVITKEVPVLNTTGYGYGGYGPGWGAWGGGISSATTTVSSYTEGTLVIDAYRPSDKKLVWRGTGTVNVSSKPEKRVRQVEDILQKLGRRWEKILRNQGE